MPLKLFQTTIQRSASSKWAYGIFVNRTADFELGVTPFWQMIDRMIKEAGPLQLPVVTRLLRCMKLRQDESCDDAEFFARFCIESAVIDQRVAELQLMRCNHVNFRECVGKMFGVVERARQVLFERSGAVKRKLVSLLIDPTIDADRFAQHVRLAQLVESDGVDEQTWSIVAVFLRVVGSCTTMRICFDRQRILFDSVDWR
jgi:hypothetical protein